VTLAVPFSVIPAQPVEPLWPGWVARRHVTMVAAPGGTSKGLWTIDVAARVTTGRPWPGEPYTATRPPEAAIIVAPEDDANEAVAWRLKAAGANPALVFNLTTFADGSPFTLPDSVPDLYAAIAEVEKATGVKVALVIIDPLLAVVDRSLASNTAARKVIAPLQQLAHQTGAAVILTHHTVKSGSVAGSKGLTDAVRHLLLITKPGKDSPFRDLAVDKSNMGAHIKLRYAVLEDGTNSRVAYPVESSQLPESRGYTIAEPVTPPVPVPDLPVHAAGGAPPGPCKALIAREGQQSIPPSSVVSFDSGAAARTWCELKAGHALGWFNGAEGTQYATEVDAEGKAVAYTVYPCDAGA
jgi:hypothetical protein